MKLFLKGKDRDSKDRDVENVSNLETISYRKNLILIINDRGIIEIFNSTQRTNPCQILRNFIFLRKTLTKVEQ